MAKRKVLLVGWDAADWKVIRPLMDEGKMPNVTRLVEGGASGPVATIHPPLSPMLWTSIATGKRPFKHGIHGFSEPTPDGTGIRPITNLSRTCKAVWNILNQQGLRSIVVGWWPSHPAEPIDGVMVSDLYHRAHDPLAAGWPLPAQTVHPPELTQALAAVRVHPDTLTPAMVEPFIPRVREIDQDHDDRLALLLRTIAECMSIQAAAVWLMDHREWDFFAVYFEALDHFCHGFMRYRPPRQSWIGEHEFELYSNVVSRAYEMHDEMLGSLLAKAGPETTVILLSDHGFHPDHLRPTAIPDIPAGPAVEHRDFGVLAISGPGVNRGITLHSASVLDVTPTVLSLYGLPVGEDMDGKVLSRAFPHTTAAAFIPSWEDRPGNDGRHPPHTMFDAVASHEALEQMVALGYVERPDENRTIAIARTLRELRFNLGESYQDAGLHSEAHTIFTELCKAEPNEQRFAVRLFASCQALGLHDEMRSIVDDLAGRRCDLFREAVAKLEELLQVGAESAALEGVSALNGMLPESHLSDEQRTDFARYRDLARYHPAVTEYLRGQVFLAEKRYTDALAVLEPLIAEHASRPEMLLACADLYMRLRRLEHAEHVYRDTLNIDADNAHALNGLCRIALHRKQFDVAAALALDAVQKTHDNPVSHYLLGRALAGLQEYSQAAEAFRAAIALNPHFPQAHVRLATLLASRLGDDASAREHRTIARQMLNSRLTKRTIHHLPAQEVHHAGGTTNGAVPAATGDMVPLSDCLIVVTGLPRSGTSLMMQMLAAGGVEILSDNLRTADDDNPRGYLEYERVKNLKSDSSWLHQARGKAVKIVTPLMSALPPGLPCRIIVCERNLDEVIDSQEKMLARQGAAFTSTTDHRDRLKREYARAIHAMKEMLSRRPKTSFVVVNHQTAIDEPIATAHLLNGLLGGALNVTNMVAAVEPTLHRNRAGSRSR